MALEACNDAIGAAAGRELTDREKKIVQARAIELKTKIERAANDPLAVDKVMKDFADEVQANAALQKRTTALNYRAFSAIKAWRQNVDFVVKNPGEGVKAFFRGSLRNFQGAQDSLANLVQREKDARSGAFNADLVQSKLFGYAYSGADDKNIIGAWSDIKDGKVSDAKYGKNAITVAQAMDKHLEGLRVDQNQAGAFIGRAADRLFRRSHDANKIAKAGGNDYGSSEARKSWSDFVGKRMDWTKAFDGEYQNTSPEFRDKILADVWSDFSSANHLTPGEPSAPTGLGSRNIAKKLSHSRQLIFNSPTDELDYYKTFGHGNSIAENVWHNLQSGGRDIALMRKLGPNAESTLQKVHDDWAAHLKEKAGPKERKAFEDQWQGEMGNTWRLISGQAGHPNDSTVVRFLATVRQTTNTAAVGQSLFSLPNDLALKAGSVARTTGGSFGKALMDAATHQATGYGMSEVERAQWFAEMGLRTEGAHMPVDPFLADHAGFGQIAKFNQQVMRLTGHSWWDNRFRSNALVADGFRHWSLRDTAFEKLNPDQQATFQKFGIGKTAWDVLRKSDGVAIDKNMKAFQPSQIRSMDLQKFKTLVQGTDKPTDSQLTRARNGLADNYRNMMGELADRSVSAPSIAGSALMKMGVDRGGPIQNELYRGALQLKGWATNYMRNHLGAELYGRDTEMMSFGQKMASVLRGKEGKAVMGVAKLVAAGIPIASATYALKDLASLKSPQDPLSKDALLRSFARQGLGLYTDFLLQDSQPGTTFFEKVGRMTGPEFGLLSDIVNNSSRMVEQINSKDGMTPEKLGRDEKDWLMTAAHNTPGTRLYWTKFAFDYFILNNIAEQMNPGYQQRLMANAAKKGQTYLPGGAGPQTTP